MTFVLSKAFKQARSGVARSNTTRSDYLIQELFVVIGSVDRSLQVDRGSLQIVYVLTQQPDTASMEVFNFDPVVGQSIIISTGSSGNRIFNGTVTRVIQHSVPDNGKKRYHIEAIDGTWLMNRRRVTKKYLGASVQVFTGSTTWTPPAGVSAVNVLVVGAGGGGGSCSSGGGGGGGGGVSMQTGVPVGASVAVTVGAGGAAGASSSGGNGGASAFDAISAPGGGGGGGQGSGSSNVVSFSTNGSWVCPAGVTSVSYLIVGAGGAGGGVNGGGGGGGGVLTGTDTVVPGTSYPIVIGAGGSLSNGGDSSFNGHTAAGGGRGGDSGVSGSNGGCGGGGGDGLSGASSGGTGSQGGNGGSSGSFEAAGGGGGGAAPANGGAASFSAGGAGGAGISSSITGAAVTYGGGGGGNGNSSSGSGGSGGGGNAGAGGNPGTPGTDGLGGGGGAGGSYNGGRGVVILAYTAAGANQGGASGANGGGGSTGTSGGVGTSSFAGGNGGASAAGGGGGAGSAGNTPPGSTGGAGGSAATSAITGASLAYGAGGGGYGSGAAGGTGAGAGGTSSTPGVAGTANTGGGGGGGGNGQAGGAGGSGVVIVAWGTSASDAFRDVVRTFMPGFSTNHVLDGAPQLPGDLVFVFELGSTALQAICDAVRWNKYVDPYNDLHFFPTTEPGVVNPQTLSATNYRYDNLEYTLDLTQIRTRAIMAGGGATTTAPVAVGATTVPVTDCSQYATAGGTFVSGTNIVTYTGLSTASGPGNLTGCSGITVALNQGDECRVLAIVDDTAAQAALAALEGGDGIHEYFEQNDAWTLSAAIAAGQATLAAYRTGNVTGSYLTYDRSTALGRQVPIQIAGRSINTTVTLQRVTRSLAAPTQWQFLVDFALVWNDFIDVVTQNVTP